MNEPRSGPEAHLDSNDSPGTTIFRACRNKRGLFGSRSTPENLPDFRFWISEGAHPKFRVRRAPFAVNTKAGACWIPLIEAVILDSRIVGDVATVVRQFFDTITTFLITSPHA